MRLGLRRAAYDEPDAIAFHSMLGAAESLKAARAARRAQEGEAQRDISPHRGPNPDGRSFCPEPTPDFGLLAFYRASGERLSKWC